MGVQLGQILTFFGRRFKVTGLFSKTHDGIDLDSVDEELKGTDWLNLREGVVRRARIDSYGGKYIQIKHSDGTAHWTLHHDTFKAIEGQSVSRGQAIAVCGNSGKVSPKPSPAAPNAGSHIHIGFQLNSEVWSSNVDPSDFLLSCIDSVTPRPPAADEYVVKRGGWISNIVNELIEAGIWNGPHTKELDDHFYSLNNPTPSGGYRPGMIVRTGRLILTPEYNANISLEIRNGQLTKSKLTLV